MSWIDSIINRNSGLIEDWSIIKDVSDIDAARVASNDKPAILFKHSTTCGISMAAKDRVETDWTELNDICTFYYLDLLNYRAISNKIAEELKVVHQSPQVIVLNKGEVIYHASHAAITGESLKSVLEKLA